MTIFQRCVSVLFMLPSLVFAADNAFMDDAKNMVRETGEAINKASDKIEKTANDVGVYVADSTITAQVKTKLLAEDDIPSTKLSINTEAGVVSVKGEVDTDLQSDKIVAIIKSIEGVKSVNTSELKVTSSKDYLSDAMITAQVKTNLMQLSLDGKIDSASSLHVETTDGVVHIYGEVLKKSEIKTIKDSVSKLDGVKEVKTNLKTSH